ncbi:MAG: hypothetical protein ACYDAG_08205 [Chloroflexota bacterium]
MSRRRAGMWTAVIVLLLVVIVTAGVFSIESNRAYSQCAALPGVNPCAAVHPPSLAVDALFVALFGMLAAIVMAVTAGVNWRNLQVPDLTLARRVEEEDRAHERAMAQMRIQAQQADRTGGEPLGQVLSPDVEEQAAATSAGTGEAVLGAMPSSPESAVGGPAHPARAPRLMELAEDEDRPETADEVRHRVMAERLKNVAKRKPEAVAGVVTNWINEPNRPA